MKLLNKPRLRDAITALTDEKWNHYEGGDASTIVWDNPENAPSIEALNSKLSELISKWEANQYQRDRASAYPSWQDQMDLLYHGGVDALKAELKKTKDKYPKPT